MSSINCVREVKPQPTEYLYHILNVLEKQEESSKFNISIKLTLCSRLRPNLNQILDPHLNMIQKTQFENILKEEVEYNGLLLHVKSISDLRDYIKLTDQVTTNPDDMDECNFCQLQINNIDIYSRQFEYTLKLNRYEYEITYENGLIQDDLYKTLMMYKGTIKLHNSER